MLSWAAATVGVVLIVASVAERIRRGRQAREPAAPTEAPSVAPASSSGPAAVPWPSLLSTQQCDAPCCGGDKCAVEPSNARDYPQFCRPGSHDCAPCASGLTCIPGGCELELGRGEAWQLRVSAVRSAASPPRSVCDQADAAMRVCVAKSDGVRACWTSGEICKSGGPLLPVSTDDLVGAGIDVEIQDATGRTVSKAHRAFAEGMRRRGLCTGYVVRGFGAQAAYGEVQLFLLP